MTWTIPKTWVTGEYMRSPEMNRQVINNLVALLDTRGPGGRIKVEQEWSWHLVAAGGIWGSSGIGGGESGAYPGIPVNWDQLSIAGGVGQIRTVWEYQVTVAAAGASVVTLIGGVNLRAIMGVAANQTAQYLGLVIFPANVVGAYSYDSDWITTGGQGQHIYSPRIESTRVGGSSGNFKAVPFVQVRSFTP